MAELKAAAVAAVLKSRPDPAILLYLVFGPDVGLVGERARFLAERAVDDPADPFQFVRLDGETIAADPGRLVDEAGTIGLFGGRRAIWVRPTGRDLAPAATLLLAAPPGGSTVVIEAGNLARGAPLRSLCQKSARALALPCYADEGRTLADLLAEAARGAGVRIGSEARAAVLASLGGDRLASRAEIDKLLLFAHGAGEITVEHVDSVLSDVSALAADGVVDAAFAGHGTGLDAGIRRLIADGTDAGVLLGAALRHALVLIGLRLDVEDGTPVRKAAEAKSFNFRRQGLVAQHLERWTSTSLRSAVARLQTAVLDVRRLPALGDVIASRTLLDLARQARR